MSAPARLCTAVAATVLALVALVSARQQQPPAPQPSQTPQRATGTLNEGVTAVLVDVVVRDKRGQPVRDLDESDFEILEDGVVQKIGSFTPVFDGVIHHDAAAAPPSGAPGPEARPAIGSAAPVTAGPGVTALVFHGLSPDGRRRALQAARSYIGDQEETANYIGIFGVELSLTPLVSFTRNGIAVRQALAKMASGVTPGFNSPEQQQRKSSAAQAAGTAAEAARAATAAAGAGNTGGVGTAAGDAQLAMMQARMLDTFQTMEHDQQGYIAMDALFAIVNTLGRLPGRKSLVLFSEGLSIPPDVHRLFLGVIDAANRANVSIYTMDAAGLRAQSEQAMVGEQVNQMAGAGAGILGESGGGGSGGGALTKALESNEYVLRQDPASGLGQLAQETGGIAFNNTNNLRPAFERIESDQRNYYLLGYTPIKTQFDGRFRTIQVRVKRPGLTVAARKGYFAVRDPGGAPVNAWEAPALGALEQKPVPNQFPVRAGALLFPERGRPGLVPVVVELATSPLTFQPADDGKSYTSDFTVLVRFVDQQNHVARKVSQHYEIRGELAQMEGAKRGEVVFYRESELPAGLYTMETVVYDAPSGRSSVRFSTVEVPAFKEGTLRMSSLVLVKRGEQVPESERRADNPLLVNGVALSPNLGDAVSKASKEAAFYFTIYPGAGGRTPDVMIELLLNGQIVARVPMPVPPPDASGRIQQLGRLPVAQLAPGTYDLRAVVQQGDQRVSRSTLLRLVE